MISKNAIFLSVSLTAFVMIVVFGVVTKIVYGKPAVVAAAPVATATILDDTATSTLAQPNAPASTIQAPLTHDEAATIAANAINRQDVYSVELISYLGMQSFKVVFSSGDVVYVGQDRQVLATIKPGPVVASVNASNTVPIIQAPIIQASSKRPRTGGGGGGGGGGSEPAEPNDN